MNKKKEVDLIWSQLSNSCNAHFSWKKAKCMCGVQWVVLCCAIDINTF